MLLVILPLLFTTGLLLKQELIHMLRRARFEKEALATIVLPAGKVHWIKQGKEILVDGRLFDVKSFRENNRNVSFTGFFDGEEDELIGQIKHYAEQKKEGTNPFSGLAVKSIFIPVYTEPVSLSFQNTWYTITRGFISYSESASPGFYPLDIPPPKHC